MKTAEWLQQPGESAKAYRAFALYRDANADRSLRTVAQSLSKSEGLIFRWSARHRWVARCAAFDQDTERKRLDNEEKARREMIKRHASQAQLLSLKALEALSLIEPSMLTTADVARWLQIAQVLERQARGTPTEKDAAKEAYRTLWERLGGGPEEAA